MFRHLVGFLGRGSARHKTLRIISLLRNQICGICLVYALNTFERKILSKIYGPIQENGIWRKRYNHELYNLYNDAEIKKKKKPKFPE
jgi:hypothetical protein